MSNPNNAMYVASVITTYWVVSISMVYLNKILLSNEQASISAPLFVTWFQCVLTCVICVVLGNMGEKTRLKGAASFLNDFSKVKYNMTTGALSVLSGARLLFATKVSGCNVIRPSHFLFPSSCTRSIRHVSSSFVLDIRRHDFFQ